MTPSTKQSPNRTRFQPSGRAVFHPTIIALGYCSYDILARVPRVPMFDDVYMVHVEELVHDGGGPASTALVAAARLGTRTGYIGVLDEDFEGRRLRTLFEIEGVDLSRLRVHPGAGTNVCLILVEAATARRSILCAARVDKDALELDEADRAYVQAARALHLDGHFLPAAVQAARWAREVGVKVCFDGNHPRPGLDELLPLVDWLVVAEPFPGEYTGEADPHAAARTLLALGPELLVVTLGERGCKVWTRDAHYAVPGFQVKAIDTTGAGDAFHGGFMYAMCQGWDVERSARFANAVAALNCRALGGRLGLPGLREVEALLDRE